jgi:hypothetical protein
MESLEYPIIIQFLKLGLGCLMLTSQVCNSCVMATGLISYALILGLFWDTSSEQLSHQRQDLKVKPKIDSPCFPYIEAPLLGSYPAIRILVVGRKEGVTWIARVVVRQVVVSQVLHSIAQQVLFYIWSVASVKVVLQTRCEMTSVSRKPWSKRFWSGSSWCWHFKGDEIFRVHQRQCMRSQWRAVSCLETSLRSVSRPNKER